MPDEIKRPNYFNFQFLDENDFKYEQDYHRHLREEHLLALHGWGVVGNGLEVSPTPNSEGGVASVTISPGVAVDLQGREIVLREARTEPLRNAAGTEVYVSIKWAETTEEGDRYTGSGFAGRNVYRRLTLRPEFEFTSTQPDQNSDNILLAQINLNPDSTIRNIDPSVRQSVSSWIAPNATLPGPLNINNQLSVQSNLTVNGNMGIGTTNPTARLNVDPNGSGGIVIGNPSTTSGSYTSLSLSISAAQNGYGEIQTIQSSGSSYGHLILNRQGGNVGIGTTNPSQKLTIQADYADTHDAKQLLIQGNTNPRNQLEIGYHTNNDYGSIQAVTQGGQVSLGDAPIQPSQPQIPKNLVLNPIGGKVGIGTPSPTAQLHINPKGPGGIAIGNSNLFSTEKYTGLFLTISAEKDGFGEIQATQSSNSSYANLILNRQGGNVGIGTANPSAQLNVDPKGNGGILIGNPNTGSDGYTSLRLSITDEKMGHGEIQVIRQSGIEFGDLILNPESGNVGIGTGRSTPTHRLDVRGDIGNNTTRYHSDIRWKKSIETISNALDKVTQLRGITFEWRKEEYKAMNFAPGKQIGMIAQEVESVIPQVVAQDKEGYKTVAYANLVALLIEAVKELRTQHENLLPTMQAQQAEIEGLKAELNSLKALLNQAV